MSDLSEIKRLIDDQATIFDEFKKTHKSMLEAKADGKTVTDLEAKMATMEDSMTKSEVKREELERALLAAQRAGLGGTKSSEDVATELKMFNATRVDLKLPPMDVGLYTQYKQAFETYARTGNLDAMSSDERKAMSAGSDPDGGYMLPAAQVGRVVTRLYDMSDIRRIAFVQPLSGGELEGIADIDEVDAGWVSEMGSRNDSDTPQVRKYKIVAEEMYSQPKATQRLLDDAAVDVGGWLEGKVVNKFARIEGAAFCVGDGVGKARGFAGGYTTAATADATRSWGMLEHVNTGANADFHTTKADPLQEVISAFKNGYLTNATWVTRREVLAKIRKMKEATSDRYLWEPSLQAGQPSRLLGYPLIIAQDMPALATGSLSMAFGDFRQGYTIVDRLGIRVLRDPYTSKPFVKFYTTKRTGGGVVDFDAIKLIRFSA